MYMYSSHILLSLQHFSLSLNHQTILFTTDETILERVSQHDEAFEVEMLSDGEEDIAFERPSTADADDDVSTWVTGVCVCVCVCV